MLSTATAAAEAVPFDVSDPYAILDAGVAGDPQAEDLASLITPRIRAEGFFRTETSRVRRYFLERWGHSYDPKTVRAKIRKAAEYAELALTRPEKGIWDFRSPEVQPALPFVSRILPQRSRSAPASRPQGSPTAPATLPDDSLTTPAPLPNDSPLTPATLPDEALNAPAPRPQDSPSTPDGLPGDARTDAELEPFDDPTPLFKQPAKEVIEKLGIRPCPKNPKHGHRHIMRGKNGYVCSRRDDTGSYCDGDCDPVTYVRTTDERTAAEPPPQAEAPRRRTEDVTPAPPVAEKAGFDVSGGDCPGCGWATLSAAGVCQSVWCEANPNHRPQLSRQIRSFRTTKTRSYAAPDALSPYEGLAA